MNLINTLIIVYFLMFSLIIIFALVYMKKLKKELIFINEKLMKMYQKSKKEPEPKLAEFNDEYELEI